MQLFSFLLMSAYALVEQHWHRRGYSAMSYVVMSIQSDVQVVSLSEYMNHFIQLLYLIRSK
jgi:hypothetical protein